MRFIENLEIICHFKLTLWPPVIEEETEALRNKGKKIKIKKRKRKKKEIRGLNLVSQPDSGSIGNSHDLDSQSHSLFLSI